MLTYAAPLLEYRFIWRNVLQLPSISKELSEHAHLDADLFEATLEAASRLAQEQLLPLSASGDRQGCRLVDGQVKTPDGFPEAYRLFQQGGWPALTVPRASGGQGFPGAVGALFEEMVASTNLAFGIFTHVREGVLQCIDAFAEPQLRALLAPPLASGEWLGTMCLTEPQAGSDLGLIRTQAVPREDGRWSVTGTKVFISDGDHDLTSNIIHLVLARTPDAPPGTAGISMFAVPKYNIGENRAPEERNGVAALGVEHKHGIRGNATCTLAFEQASGWLVGDLHRGLNCMFRLMNSARLAVGVQSVGLAEVAYQNALAHARTRLQGRAISGAQRPDLPADPLVAHPGVRARLIEMRLFIEAARLLTTWVATLLDQARGAEDEDLRRHCSMLAELLTPMVKGYLSEHAIRNIESAMRLYGGAGYITETGIEQVLRDATICPIYEGTNDIQALDLLGRKVVADQGKRLRLLLKEIQTLAARLQDSSELKDLSPLLADHASSLGAAAQTILVESVFDRDIVGLAAPDFLELAGGVVFAYLWARMAEAAMVSGDARLRDDKCALARYYMHRSRDRTTAIAKKIAKARHYLERLGSASHANMALAG